MKLDAETLFYMACCDVFRDGTCEVEENQVLNKLAAALELGREDAVRIAARARAAGPASQREGAGALEPVALYTSACQVAWVDEKLETGESQVLVELAEVLGIAYEDASRILKETRPEPSGAS